MVLIMLLTVFPLSSMAEEGTSQVVDASRIEVYDPEDGAAEDAADAEPVIEAPPAADIPAEAPAEASFLEGYVRVSAGTAAYGDAEFARLAGTFEEDSVVYAEKADAEDDSWDSPLKVTFDTQSAGEAGAEPVSVYVKYGDAEVLSAAEAEQVTAELSSDESARIYRGAYLPVALYAAEEDPFDGETAEDAETTVTVKANRTRAAEGESVVLTATIANAVGTVSYQWQKCTTASGTWTSTTLTGNATYRLTFAATSSRCSYYYRVVATDLKGSYNSNAVKVTYEGNANPVITASAGSSTAVAGKTVTITATASNTTGSVSYRWMKSSTNSADRSAWSYTTLTGYSTRKLTFAATEARLSYYYCCAVTDDNGVWYSNSVKITMVTPKVTIKATPTNAEEGTTVKYSVTVSGMTGTVSYRWQRSADRSTWENTSLTGYNTAALTFPATEARLSYYYRCRVTDDNGTWYSTAAKITYIKKPTITITASPTAAAADETVKFTVTVSNAGGTPSYRWQRCLTNSTVNSDWSNTTLTGYATRTLMFAATEARLSYYYRCAVTDNNGTWYSDGRKINFIPKPIITISASPTSAAEGETVTFRVTVSGTSGTVKYRWQRCATNSSVDSAWTNTSLTGYATRTLSFPATEARLGYYYRCAVTDNNGTWYSAGKKIYMYAPTISITASPASAAEGTTVTFRVTVSGTSGTVKYRWQRCATNSTVDSDWTNTSLTGYNTRTLSFPATEARLGYYYRCAVTDNNGTRYSAGKKITYIKAPTISITATPASAAEGETVTFRVTVSNASGTVKYRWQRCATNSTADSDWTNTSLTGYNTQTLSFPATQDRLSYYYRCAVTDNNGTWYSAGKKITYINAPTISITATPASAAEGTTVTFRVTVSGATGTVSYRWQRCSTNSTVDSDWTNTTLTGYDTQTLSFPATEERLNYYYRCAVTDSSGTWYSAGKKITYIHNVTVTATANCTGAMYGDTVTITASVSNASGSLTYRWQYSTNGSSWSSAPTSMSGYNTYRLSFHATPTLLKNYYRCAVTDNNGTWYSNSVKITAPKCRALLIGNEAYSEPVLACHNSMNVMASMLKGLSNGYTITKKPDLTASGIISAIPSAFSGATDNDVSLFFYNGHGVGSNSSSYMGALVGVDGNAVQFTSLRSALNQIPGKIILILDSCHSGAAITDRGSDELEAFNRSVIDAFSDVTYTRTVTDEEGRSSEFTTSKYMVITACQYSEEAMYRWYIGSEDEAWSVFTSYLVEGLGCNYWSGSITGSMPADTNSDSVVTLYEAYKYARDNTLSDNSGQHAQYYGTGSTPLFFR